MRTLYLYTFLLFTITDASFIEDEKNSRKINSEEGLVLSDESCLDLMFKVGDGEISSDEAFARVNEAVLGPSPLFLERHKKLEFKRLDRMIAPCRDQGPMGTCWLDSTINFLDDLLSAYFGKRVKVSKFALLRGHILNRSIKILDSGLSELELSGTFNDAFDLVQKYGVILEEGYNVDLDLLNKDEYLDRFLVNYMASVLDVKNKIEKRKISRKEGIKKIKKSLSIAFPKTPEYFVFDDQEYNGRALYENALKGIRSTGAKEWDHFREKIIKNIKKSPQLISIEILSEYVDRKHGILSISGFLDTNHKRNNMNDKIMSKLLDNSRGAHAIVLYDYATTDDGEIVFIGKNSWGEDWGDSGRIYIYEDYLREFFNAYYTHTSK